MSAPKQTDVPLGSIIESETEQTATKKYPLPIAPKYVDSWSHWEAVRELLQNAIDQCTLDPKCELVFTFDSETGILTVGNTCSRIPAKCLILGNGSKDSNSELIGNHGEGCKLAMLVLCRYGHAVTVYNGPVIWTPCFEYSDLFEDTILTVHEKRADPAMAVDGVFFAIDGITQEIFDSIVEKYMPNFDNGEDEILHDEYQKGKIYVAGLYVCTIDALDCGYNFAPSTVKLDRDRRLIPTYEVAAATSVLWSKTENHAALYDKLMGGSLDAQYVRNLPEAASEYVRDRFITDHPDATPVSTQAEAEIHVNPHIVPAVLKSILHDVHEFKVERTGTPCAKLMSFKNRFFWHLGEEGQNELKCLIGESKHWVEKGKSDG